MYGYIYLTTNLINNKKYIGKHKSQTFNNNYKGSGIYLLKAFNKYGKENFKVELLEKCNNQQELNDKEIYYIALYNAVQDKNYYNVAKGGDGGLIENQILINNGDINIFVDKENLNNYLQKGWVKGLKPGRINGPKSDKSKQIMSQKMKNKKHSGDWNLNQKLSFKNKKYHWFTNGKDNLLISESELIPDGFYKGKTYSKESNNKISQSKKGRFYITNGSQDKLIYPNQFDLYKNQGYWKGRTHWYNKYKK